MSRWLNGPMSTVDGPGQEKPGAQWRPVEPRLVVTLVLLAVPLLWVVANILLVPAQDGACSRAGVGDHVGGFTAMFLPSRTSCLDQPHVRR